MSASSSTLNLYRHILRAAKSFPSIKKHTIIREIKQEFRANRSLNDTEKVKQCVAAAERGLSDLQAYSGAQRSQFDIFLKGNM